MLGMWDRLSTFLQLSEEESKKIVWLTTSFFCVIGSYTILKEMKDSLFVNLVGAEYLWKVKMVSLFTLVPATLLYARLVDVMRKSNLLWFYATLYSVAGVLIALFVSNSHIGLMSDPSNPYRQAFGWFIYLFYEGANPFVVSLFWSYTNSITPPESAKKGYSVMVAGSKLGGMTFAAIAWFLFSVSESQVYFTDVSVYQFLLIGSSLTLLLAPYIVHRLKQNVSEESMHGYEAAYKADHKGKEKKQTGILSGLKMMVQHPYILGLFGMIFFYEIINVILGLQRLGILQGTAKSLSGFNGSLFYQRFLMHGLGFIISFFGTRPLIRRLGERVCLILIPVITASLLIYFMLFYNEQAVLFVFMALGTINYAFASPLRESLYIPTVRDIRFKSKAWIDSFGTKFSKWWGAAIVGTVQFYAVSGSALYMTVFSSIFGVISLLWIGLAWVLGNKYDSLVKNDQVIGSE